MIEWIKPIFKKTRHRQLEAGGYPKLGRPILRIFLYTSASLYLSFAAHNYATIQRGYKAFGGEFLLLPLMIVLKEFGATAVEGWKEWKEEQHG